MRDELHDAVRSLLGEDCSAVDVLSNKALAELHHALLEARTRQAAALTAASEEALRQMPAPLRGSFLQILGR